MAEDSTMDPWARLGNVAVAALITAATIAGNSIVNRLERQQSKILQRAVTLEELRAWAKDSGLPDPLDAVLEVER